MGEEGVMGVGEGEWTVGRGGVPGSVGNGSDLGSFGGGILGSSGDDEASFVGFMSEVLVSGVISALAGGGRMAGRKSSRGVVCWLGWCVDGPGGGRRPHSAVRGRFDVGSGVDAWFCGVCWSCPDCW